VDLATLGKLRVMSHSAQREPVEAPQYEPVTYTVRLDLLEQSFQDNFTLIAKMVLLEGKGQLATVEPMSTRAG
jgi:hypothetical protein